ncbi:BLOC-3 complex member HPS1-like [Ptychodera flava]|uniref:BLOC-3 complex member HPS1-like n=1 Tax=Ptychodera flava TaxID=63121 RepID=UPI003969C040
MKCLLVVMNLSMPDIVYLAADREFTQHINDIAVEKGLIQEDDVTDEVDLNAATQFFSPIVASQGMLANELDNPYSSISCGNGFIFVFKEYGEHLYIAVNGDGQEDEEFLQRKLLVLQKLIGFLYGPIVEKLRPDRQSERNKVWSKLTNLMNTWDRLYREEQSFLLEAVERLHVGQSLNELCINILEMSLNKMKAGGERYPIHALLTVNAKLLALYSSRNANELLSSDQLLIILMVQELYPSSTAAQNLISPPASPHFPPNEGVEGAISQSADFTGMQEEVHEEEPTGTETGPDFVYPGSDAVNPELQAEPGIVSESQPEPDAESEQTFVHKEDKEEDKASTPETAKIFGIIPAERSGAKYQRSQSEPIPSRDVSASMASAASYDQYVTPVESVSAGKFIRKFKQKITETRRGLYMSTEEESFFDTATTESLPPMLESSYQMVDSEISDYRSLMVSSPRIPVFLRTKLSQYSPHELHVIQVLPETVLVVITEIKSSLAGLVTRCLSALEHILKVTNSAVRKTQEKINGKLVIENLDNNIRKICEIAKKFSQYGKTPVQSACSTLPVKWENLKKAGFLEHLDSAMPSTTSPRLETCLSEMIKALKYIFQVRFLSKPGGGHLRYHETVNSIEKTAKKRLGDYREYLSVKGQRNIAMTAYMEDFPGLVHFIYVDRTVDLLTAPSINSTGESEQDEKDPSQLLKKKIWEMVKHCQSYLQKGYISVMRREGDYYYTYFIWFEDPMGNPLRMIQPPKLDVDGTPVGILAGHFYRKLVRQCFPNAPFGSVHCFELMCMHVGVVPVQYVVNHCHHLASKLWETSGELNSPISLL